jgi:hypothetical protein
MRSSPVGLSTAPPLLGAGAEDSAPSFSNLGSHQREFVLEPGAQLRQPSRESRGAAQRFRERFVDAFLMSFHQRRLANARRVLLSNIGKISSRASDIRLTLDPPSAEVARQRGTPAFQTLFQRREEFGCAIRFRTSTDATALSSSHLTLCWSKGDSNSRSHRGTEQDLPGLHHGPRARAPELKPIRVSQNASPAFPTISPG